MFIILVYIFAFKIQSQFRSDEEKAISENYSSLVNKAYSVLQSPLKRAIHLLAIKGEQIQEDQKLENPQFLMEIMELNEEVQCCIIVMFGVNSYYYFRLKKLVHQKN